MQFSFRNPSQLCVIDVCFYFVLLQLTEWWSMSEGLPQGRGICVSSSVNLVGAAGVTFEAMVVLTFSQDSCESSNFACCISDQCKMMHFGFKIYLSYL